MAHSPNRVWRRAVASLRFALRAERIGNFLGYTAARFFADGCLGRAAELSYASLLAIVPLFAVGLSILAGFPAFEPVRQQILDIALTYLLPRTGLDVNEQFAIFIANASKMTGPGLIGLGVTAILLLSAINGALNGIWHASEARPLALRVMVYWVLLTLGPLLVGASITISGYAYSAVVWTGVGELAPWTGYSRLLSITVSAVGFSLIYLLVPNRAVHPGHAAIGGIVAAILLELLKAAFGLYLRVFPAYQLVYGAVAVVPIFLVWMYLSWVVILFGAEIAAALPEWRSASGRRDVPAGPGASLALALSLLARLRQASRTGTRLRERGLVRGLPAMPAEIDTTLRRLRRAGLIERTLGGRWLIARDLSTVTLGDLANTLDLGLSPGTGWPPAAQAAAQGVAAAAAEPLAQTLENLLARGVPERGPAPTAHEDAGADRFQA